MENQVKINKQKKIVSWVIGIIAFVYAFIDSVFLPDVDNVVIALVVGVVLVASSSSNTLEINPKIRNILIVVLSVTLLAGIIVFFVTNK